MSLWEEGKNIFVAQLRDNKVKEDEIQDFLASQSTCDEARKSAVAIKGDSDRKYGKVHSWLNKIIDNLDRFVAQGNVAMQAAPETVGLAWFAVSTALTALQNDKKLYNLFGSSLVDMTDLMVLISIYDELYDKRNKKPDFKVTDIVSQVFDKIRKAYAGILDYSFFVRKRIRASRKRDKFAHVIGSTFGAYLSEFQDKADAIDVLKSKVIEASEAAFRQGAFENFDNISGQITNVQSTLGTVASSIRQAQDAAIRNDRETRELLRDIRDEAKLKTHLELALQTFRKNGKALNPLPDSKRTYELYLQREEGTCSWLLDDQEYVKWRDSSSSTMLHLGGERGCGKSTLAAFVVQSLLSQLSESIDCSVQYLFYDEKYVNEANTDQAVARLENTLVYQLYKICADEDHYDDDNRALRLQRANGVFENPKPEKLAGLGIGNNKKASEAMALANSLSDTYEDIMQVLSKKVYLVIDGADGINHPARFVEHLQDLVNKPGIKIHILLASGHTGELSNCLYSIKVPQIIVGQVNNNVQNNMKDIEAVIQNGLKQIPGLSQSERSEAFQTVKEKTGAIMNYPIKIALPFLRQPFQRPLSSHLNRLPNNVNETYIRHIRQLAPNYLDLLKTSLKWTLLGQTDIRAREIIDAYTGIYLTQGREEAEETSLGYDSDALCVEQIRDAGAPFFNIANMDNPVVAAKDRHNMMAFFFKSETENRTARGDEESNCCARCKMQLDPSHEFTMSEKEEHLKMAITCNVSSILDPVAKPGSPASRNVNSQSEKARIKTDNDEQNNDDSQKNANMSNGQVYVKDQGNPETLSEDTHIINQNSAEVIEDRTSTREDVTQTEENADTNIDRDDSVDSDDREKDWNLLQPDIDGEAENNNVKGESYLRYEFFNWWRHVREAEKRWSPEERVDSPDWHILLDQFRTFYLTNQKAYRAWQISVESPGLQPIHDAALFGLVSLAKVLIENGADIMEPTPEGITSLHIASIIPNNFPILKFLLEKGADPNKYTDRVDATPFYQWLLCNTDEECVQLFLEHGASSQMRDKDGWTALHYFAHAGTNLKVLDLLLNDNPKNENGKAEINAQDDRGETPLHKIVCRKRVPTELLKAMIERGADPDKEDKNFERPLEKAAYFGDTEAVKVILDSIGDMNSGNWAGRTALQVAASCGHTETVRALLDWRSGKSAKPNLADKHGRTPLFFACLGCKACPSGSETVANIILDRLVQDDLNITEINAETVRGRTVLREASAHGFKKVVRYILDHLDPKDKAAINRQDSLKGRTALHCASYHGHREIVGWLLDRGADVNLRDGCKADANEGSRNEGKTALELCVEVWEKLPSDGLEQTILKLIEASPAEAARYKPLLLTAVVNGSVPVLEWLLKEKANFNISDQYGWTPLLLARQLENKEVEDFLNTRVAQINLRPSRWASHWDESTDDKSYPTLTNESRTVSHPGNRYICLLADKPVPAGVKKYYFELEILPAEDDAKIEGSKTGPENGTERQATPPPEVREQTADGADERKRPAVAIGFTSTPKASALLFPGWLSNVIQSVQSWAYHADDGGFFTRDKKHVCHDKWGFPGDVVGAGVDFEQGTIWFTQNGKMMSDRAFENVKGRLFPVLGLRDRIRVRGVFEDEVGAKGRAFMWRG